ncbi:putative calcium uptake protein 1, mitochondrial [Iris pallida]|uniref:Calcium uptake protein 1, mitochondrial n=1 Tax=Iris pallida TaxID=29817 RepID=A0AAX6I9C4_IRIPA|nr:putative calcium uptake protein 1, mitochondrial [Iris pallida]
MLFPRSSSPLLRTLAAGRRTFSSSAGPYGKRLPAVAGIAAAAAAAGASALGFSFLGSPSDSPSSSSSVVAFADSGYDTDRVLEPSGREKKPRFLFGDSYRKKVFFNYEKRIRMQSPPEKIFEYFASFRSPDGEVFMLPADLMRAIVPVFPPSESDIVKGGNLRGDHHPGELCCAPSEFFLLFDTNNDGLISFPEYIFFVTLLSIPESSFSVAFKMFDLDHNGEIEMEEFKKVMRLMQSYNRQVSRHRDGLRIGLKVGKSVENGGLMEYFFGKDGKGCLNHDKFVLFLRDLHDEIVRLEFSHYDYKSRGTISAKDFALSMVASADINHISKFLDRVDELDDHPHLRDTRITLEASLTIPIKTLQLRRSLQPLAIAIFSYGKVNGLLTKNDFQRAASHVCGVTITDNVVDVIFHVFDANRDGSLSSEEFLMALQRRESDIRQPTKTGVTGMLSCWLKCTKNCSFSQMPM